MDILSKVNNAIDVLFIGTFSPRFSTTVLSSPWQYSLSLVAYIACSDGHHSVSKTCGKVVSGSGRVASKYPYISDLAIDLTPLVAQLEEGGAPWSVGTAA